MTEMALQPGRNDHSSDRGPCRLPLEVFPPDKEPLTAQRAAQWIWLLMILGIIARVVRYLLRYPLWEDECFLAANYVGRGYLDLLQPLEYHQVAPFLFLWVQLTLVKLLGFHEYSLRLLPFLASVASLFVFRHLTGRLLKGSAVVFAVGIFAVAYPGIRYCAEAKPYGSDLFLSVALMALAVEWLRRPEQTRWLWMMIAVMPLVMGISYPAVFVAGGISIAMACRLWGLGRGRVWRLWGVYNLVVAGSFAAVFLLSAIHQSDASLGPMQAWWKDQFPPLDSPLKLPGWLLLTHTSDLLAYPFGGHNYGSTLTFLCCVAALAALVRRRQYALIALCLGPLALNFLAAALHRYPYGGHVRIAMYLAPIVCLLAGLGASVTMAWHASRRGQASTPALVTLTLLAIMGAGSACRDLSHQSKSDPDLQARDFARWFWLNKAFDSEIVCLKTDLGRTFTAPTLSGDDSSLYFCNQQIYSPRHRNGKAPDLSRVSAERPLCCVRFHSNRIRYDEAAFAVWLREMASRYQIVARQKYPFPCYVGQKVRYVQYVETYEFVPKTPASEGSLTAMKPLTDLERGTMRQ